MKVKKDMREENKLSRLRTLYRHLAKERKGNTHFTKLLPMQRGQGPGGQSK